MPIRVGVELQAPRDVASGALVVPLGGSWGLLHFPSSLPWRGPGPAASARRLYQAGVGAPTRVPRPLGQASATACRHTVSEADGADEGHPRPGPPWLLPGRCLGEAGLPPGG